MNGSKDKKKFQVMVTRPAWIQEIYEVELEWDEAMNTHKGRNIKAVRKMLEDESTVQIESQISCHMDHTNGVDCLRGRDEYAEVHIDEIEEIIGEKNGSN